MSAAYLAACVTGVWLTWTAHDYLQERIFKVPGFHFGLFMAFSLQTVSFLLSLVYRLWTHLLDDGRQLQQRLAEEQSQRRLAAEEEEQGENLLEDDEEQPAAPKKADDSWPLQALAWYLSLSLLIATANGSATAALNFVNMQTKVLFKSSKIVTVMLLGRLCFGKSYSCMEYSYMLHVVLGLVAFLLASSGGALGSSLPGVALLSLAILSDSLVPNVQQRLLTGLKRPKHELVFHTNWVSALLTACYMAATGEGVDAFLFLRRRPHVSLLLLLQSVCGYFGVLTYLEVVHGFGPKVTVIVTSCRKLFTICLSSVLFGHPLNGFHLVGVACVFGGVLWNANADMRCSRWLAPPALVVAALLVGVELHLDDTILDSSWRVLLGPLRSLLLKRIIN